MIRGRLCRFLTLLFGVYLLFTFVFFRSFDSETSEETTTTSPLPHAQRKGDEVKVKEEPVVPPVEKKPAEPEDPRANLQPVMTKGVLGNYEPKNLKLSSDPGEGGAGVVLVGDEEKKLGEQSVADYGFNEVASEKISLDRHARDTR